MWNGLETDAEYVRFVCTDYFSINEKWGREKKKEKKFKNIDDRPTEEENFFGRFKSQAVLISRVPSRR